MSNITPDKTLLQSIIRMVDTVSAEGSYDTLINVLALLCIITILNKQSPQARQQAATSTPAASPIQKLLGELTKNDGGGGGSGGPSLDTIMSLLPLLNSPQLKSKLNPANMSTILGLINSLSGSGNDKHESSKNDKQEKPEPKAETKKAAPAAAVTESIPLPSEPETEDDAKKTAARYLNWKTNF
ncbi:hypothetical protein HSX37_00035|uniref:Uncharacterized protein n=1 Tax=Dendrosporobacter quercicolus TaxID=146817 RepID=A0A1G9KL82_9FIRM|nr:hypothetical protein [Dendrosporobacter quercicolus]NSL46441.1 hypothetical protein [Dendrosporobacter quercicolus DSM 1736]SDL50481.1 hypothetical protein SAMN04488502_10173 [Dendrosporobacter quercicolus]